MIPVTWGRISAMPNGAVRPGSSVVRVIASGLTVWTTTSGGGGAGSAAAACERSHAADAIARVSAIAMPQREVIAGRFKRGRFIVPP